MSAVSLPEREKSWRGLCRPWGLSARTSSRSSVPQLWVLPSELLEILEASVQRDQAFCGFHSATLAVGLMATFALHRPTCWLRGLGSTLACGWESRSEGL